MQQYISYLKMVFFKKFLSFLSLCIVHIQGKGLNPLSTTTIIQDSFVIEGNNVAEYVTLETELLNAGTPNAYFNIEADVLKELPPQVMIILKIDKFNSNKKVYEPTPLSIEKIYCRYMKMDKIVYPIILKKGNFPKTCPVLPGKYYIRNFTVTPEDLPISIPIGSYKVTFAYRLQGKEVRAVWKGRSMQNN